MWHAKFSPIFFHAISLVGCSASATLAQTVPDNILGSESSTVNQNATVGDREARSEASAKAYRYAYPLEFPEGNHLVDL